MRKISLLAMALVSFLLAGCATSLGGASYGQADARVEQRVRLGVVYSVRDVAIEGTGLLGTVAGGVIGGFAGSKIGKGNGAKIMTVLGALGGAMVGNSAERHATQAVAVEITIRLETGELVAITQAKELAFPVKSGDVVRIVGTGRSSRVGPG